MRPVDVIFLVTLVYLIVRVRHPPGGVG